MLKKDTVRVATWIGAMLAVSGVLVTPHAEAQSSPPGPVVAPLLTKELADIEGKEVLMLSVTYPPGGADPVHRHDAHGFIYVLEGEIVMGVKGGEEVRLKPGQTFYEGPQDIHTVGRNASNTNPAKFLVLLVKNRGTDPVLPVR
jgi:quercetin dioxygenase-like cupin family protein